MSRTGLLVSGCLLLLLPLPAAARTPGGRIVGRVFERASTIPIPGAMLRAHTGQTATADDEGNFSIDVPAGEIGITVVAPGYERLDVVEHITSNLLRTVEYRMLPVQTPGKKRYETIVRGQSPHEGERFELREEELLQAPGSLGDPFRVIAALPGVIQPIPLLPIYVVRGGAPGMNGFFLDGMRVPQLFHLVITDGVVHPRILDHIDFFPGSYDATFGRYAAGVVDAGTRPGRTDAASHGELELKLYDSSALFEARLPDGATLLAAGRYGYPGPLIHLFNSTVNLSYWDYQLRFDWHGLTAEALGSHDSLSIAQPGPTRPQDVAAQLLVEFHRLQLRDRFRLRRLELEAAVVGGLDKMSVLSGQGVQKLSASARANARLRLHDVTLLAGIDGEVSRFTAENFQTSQPRSAPDDLGELAGNRDGVVGGAYLQANVSLERLVHRASTLTLGVRSDVYHAGQVTLAALDARGLFRVELRKHIELFGGAGQYTQAPSFPVPLPGIDTFALQLGLQRAIQGSAGVRVALPDDLSVSATAYYGRFLNVNDVVLDLGQASCTSAPPESLTGLAGYVTRVVDGDGYGLELLARKELGRMSGWLAYTISRAERDYACGTAPSDFDQTHVANAVVQWRLPKRYMLGMRANFSTGRPYTLLRPDLATSTFVGTRNNERLPTYFQLDLRMDREWIFQRWALALFVEILNATYSESVFGITFPKDPATMITRYDQPTPQGFRWLLPSVGLRGRF